MKTIKAILIVICLFKLGLSAACGHSDFPWDNPCNGTCNGDGYCGGTWPCHCVHSLSFLDDSDLKSKNSIISGELVFQVSEKQKVAKIQGSSSDDMEMIVDGQTHQFSIKKIETKFEKLRNQSCCCGIGGISCGPCSPPQTGIAGGIGCCCSWK